MRLLCVLFLYSVAMQSAFAVLDYKQLAATKKDQPAIVTTTEDLSVPNKYGALEIPKGSTVKVTGVKADGTLDVDLNGQICSIPASKTDIEKRVTEIEKRAAEIRSRAGVKLFL